MSAFCTRVNILHTYIYIHKIIITKKKTCYKKKKYIYIYVKDLLKTFININANYLKDILYNFYYCL